MAGWRHCIWISELGQLALQSVDARGEHGESGGDLRGELGIVGELHWIVGQAHGSYFTLRLRLVARESMYW